MGFQYNGAPPKELLLRRDGTVELIRRAETVVDYLRTQLDFEPMSSSLPAPEGETTRQRFTPRGLSTF